MLAHLDKKELKPAQPADQTMQSRVRHILASRTLSEKGLV